jgi:hypothetical protein
MVLLLPEQTLSAAANMLRRVAENGLVLAANCACGDRAVCWKAGGVNLSGRVVVSGPIGVTWAVAVADIIVSHVRYPSLRPTQNTSGAN